MNMDLFELPAGDFFVGVGYEHREEEANFKPGGFMEEGRGRSVAIFTRAATSVVPDV